MAWTKSVHRRLAQQGPPIIHWIWPHPRVKETLLCQPVPSLTFLRRSKPRCWLRCGAPDTATCCLSTSYDCVPRDATRRRSPPSCSARSPACTARCAPIRRERSTGSTTPMGGSCRRCAPPSCSTRCDGRCLPYSRHLPGRMGGAARAGAVPAGPDPAGQPRPLGLGRDHAPLLIVVRP